MQSPNGVMDGGEFKFTYKDPVNEAIETLACDERTKPFIELVRSGTTNISTLKTSDSTGGTEPGRFFHSS